MVVALYAMSLWYRAVANVRGMRNIYADFAFSLLVKVKFGKSMEDLKEMHSKEVRCYFDFKIFGFVHFYVNILNSCYGWLKNYGTAFCVKIARFLREYQRTSRTRTADVSKVGWCNKKTRVKNTPA